MIVYFVYEDWTAEPTPRCFYVGKGLDGRVKDPRRNKHHSHIADKYSFVRQVVFSSSDEVLALAKEVQLIAEHKTFVHDPSYTFGANYTCGGEGSSGARHEWSDHRRKQASEAQKRRFNRPKELLKHSLATQKQWNDQERLDRQVERMKCLNPAYTHPDTEQTRNNKSEGQKRRYDDPSERYRMSELTKASAARPEVFQKRSKAQKARRARERQIQ